MIVDLSPASYLLLCGLVKDALEVRNDAAPLLRKAAAELSNAMETQPLPAEVAAKSEIISTLKGQTRIS